MHYREAGQFKTTYVADQQIFPILQDRLFVLAVIVLAFLAVPMFASPYLYTEILIPFLILSLAAIGLNILVGYCGQVSLGTGGFMAVGAYAAYNLWLRVPELNNLIVVFLFGGLMAAAVGILFGIPSLRIKGFYLAVATLASQFFLDWLFARVKWLTNYTPSGSVAVGKLEVFGWHVDTPADRYLLILGLVVVATLVAKNLVRGHIGRSWMAIRDMDIAAEIIGFRPLRTKLTAFAHFARLDLAGSLHRADADPAQPASRLVRHQDVDGPAQPSRIHGVRRHDRLLPDRRAAWPGPPVVGRQGETAALAVSALIY